MSLWAVVLAGGEGARLKPFVYETFGLDLPKQFVAFTGRRSMLQHTVARASRLAPRDRILVVAGEAHRRRAEEQLADSRGVRLVFQPANRETAPGVLLPLTWVLAHDPDATVAFLPADHFVMEEERFNDHVRAAASAVGGARERVVLLGISPDGPETEYGWIVPGERVSQPNGTVLRRIERFVEKPGPDAATALWRRGALWNSFVTVARAETLYRLILRHAPELGPRFDRIAAALGTPSYASRLSEEYRAMAPINLSSRVLQAGSPDLSVIPVDGVFWSDWGSASRIRATLERLGRAPAWGGVMPSLRTALA